MCLDEDKLSYRFSFTSGITNMLLLNEVKGIEKELLPNNESHTYLEPFSGKFRNRRIMGNGLINRETHLSRIVKVRLIQNFFW